VVEWLSNDCTHSHSADLLHGTPLYRLGQVLILLRLHEIVKSIREKVITVVATRCHIPKLTCTSAFPDRLSRFKGSCFKGKGGEDIGEEGVTKWRVKKWEWLRRGGSQL